VIWAEHRRAVYGRSRQKQRKTCDVHGRRKSLLRPRQFAEGKREGKGKPPGAGRGIGTAPGPEWPWGR